MNKSRSLWCQAPNLYSIKELEINELKEGEVLIRVSHVGICGSDLAIFRGLNPFVRYPLIPGHEFCGEAIVSNDSSCYPGQFMVVMPVVGCGDCESCLNGHINRCSQVKLYGVHMNGGLTEFAIIQGSQLLPVKGGVDPINVVFTEPVAVGVHCNRIGGTRQGSKVAIIGGGIIGLVILNIAKLLQAESILVVDNIQERLNRAERLGAKYVYNTSQNHLKELINSHFQRNFYDVVYDVVGNNETLDAALDLLKPGGKLVIVAVPEGENRAINTTKIFAQEKKITASRTYTMNDFVKALDLIMDKKVDPSNFITSVFPLDSIETAIQKAEKEKGKELKIVIKV